MIEDADFTKLTEASRAAEAAKAALDEARSKDAAQAELDLLAKRYDDALAGHAALRGPVFAGRGESNRRFAGRHEQFAIDYQVTPDLRTAVKVAMALGRPLLLTGDPGTGKTLCAFWLAKLFGDGEVLRFQVRSDSRARDLLYVFDAASWFRQSQIKQEEVSKTGFLRSSELGKAFGWDERMRDQPAVVLIDEIDKAPRDFPNDLLHELDQMSFRVEETGQTIACDVSRRPIVVITSNSERQLPPPFLRRCIVHHIRLDPETVIRILRARLRTLGATDNFFGAAGEFWKRIDDNPSLGRKPTIDEYWRWLALEVQHGAGGAAVIEGLGKPDAGKFRFLSTLLADADLKRVVA